MYSNEPQKIIFETEEFEQIARPTSQSPKIIQWIIAGSGGTMTEVQAERLVASFLLIIIFTTLIGTYILNTSSNETRIEVPPGKRLVYPPNEPPRVIDEIK